MDALWYIVLIVEQVARANALSTFAIHLRLTNFTANWLFYIYMCYVPFCQGCIG